ncbi:MAG: transcriptional regulator [Bacteroidetes bacterium]|jgi:predicted transcriptional regulator|nr:transcriptional regulator [Bacteroidota bacterium]
MEKLTHQEEELMLIVFKLGKGFIRDFIDQMEDPKPPYTTVASIAKNLQRKGFLKVTRYGNVYEYSPLVDESEYKSRYLSGIVNNYFENSYKELVSFFAKKHKITAEELQEIINLIEKK